MSLAIPPCVLCHHIYCTQSCPGPTPHQRVPDYPAPEMVGLSGAARASIREKCCTSLRELEAEAASASPSPTTLRALASTVARSCPLEYRALAGPVVRLSEGLAGLYGCREEIAEPAWEPGDPIRSPVSTTILYLRRNLTSACVTLRVQLQVPEIAEVAR